MKSKNSLLVIKAFLGVLVLNLFAIAIGRKKKRREVEKKEGIIVFQFKNDGERSAFRNTKSFSELVQKIKALNLRKKGTVCNFSFLIKAIRTNLVDIFVIDGEVYIHENSIPSIKVNMSKDCQPKIRIWAVNAGGVDDTKKALESKKIFRDSKYKFLGNPRTVFRIVLSSQFMKCFRGFKLDENTKGKSIGVILLPKKEVYISLNVLPDFYCNK